MGTSEKGSNGYLSSDSAPVAPKVTKRVLEQGNQTTYPKNNQMVALHYIGYIAETGTRFDSSLDRGQPLTVQLGVTSVIRGFDEGIRGMSLGEKSCIYIPAELGYGSRGSGTTVPPDANLFFEIKLLSIQDPPTEEESTALRNSTAGGSLKLLAYLVKLLQGCSNLDMKVFEALLPGADVRATGCSVSIKNLSLLHITSQLAEGQAPELTRTMLQKLVAAGADLDAADGYGETPLSTVLCMLEEEENKEDDDDPCPANANLLEALACYLEFDQQRVNDGIATRAQQHVGKIPAQNVTSQAVGETVIDLLARRIPRARLAELQQGTKLIEYLCTFFDTLEGADPNVVRSFLDAGADPAAVQAHSGSNAFHFIALNAYGKYDDIFRMFNWFLAKSPQAVTESDKSRFTPFSLAADYKDTAKQFGCKPNACPMLALGELLSQHDLDAGLVCLKVDEVTRTRSESRARKQSRFKEADRVKCWVQAPGANAWEEGVVVSCGYREDCWPENHPGAAYEVKLDIGNNVFVLSDTDKLIKAEHEKTKSVVGKRFVKQATEGGWELFDTATQKARPCSPPDSDSD